MFNKIGEIFFGISMIIYFISGIWGGILIIILTNKIAGFWGIVLGLTILPITFMVAPWYALFKWGYYLPLAVNYGGLILATLFFWIGSLLSKESLIE